MIIPEPLNVDRACIGHCGVWWAEIQTHGRIGHGSMPFLGDCAVRHMGAVPDTFERELWPRLVARRTAMPAVKAEVHTLLERLARERPGFAYSARDLMEVHPVLADPDLPVPQAVARAIGAVPGREARFVCSPGTFDLKHIACIGHLHDSVAYGPGILDLAHQPDEFVAIDDLVASAKVMALAALQLLGVTR